MNNKLFEIFIFTIFTLIIIGAILCIVAVILSIA